MYTGAHCNQKVSKINFDIALYLYLSFTVVWSRSNLDRLRVMLRLLNTDIAAKHTEHLPRTPAPLQAALPL